MSMPEGTRRALAEALEAIQTHINKALNPLFTLVGGYALFLHGRNRLTMDLDFAIDAPSLSRWEESVSNDPRFKRDTFSQWSYYCTGSGIEGLTVAIDFLDLQHSSDIGALHGMQTTDGYQVATLKELAILKAEAILSREAEKDGLDLIWILQRMETSLTFGKHANLARRLFGEVDGVIGNVMGKGNAGELRRLFEHFK
jgi:hypothetical protein